MIKRWLPWLTTALIILGGLLSVAPLRAADRGEGKVVKVSREGFEGSPVEVTQGAEVEIAFLYGDGDLKQNNPHRLFIGGYNIDAGILDRDNPRISVRFTADKVGEFPIMCILPCLGHSELQRGRLVVLPAPPPPAATPTTPSPGAAPLPEVKASVISLGKETFLRFCAGCHGQDGSAWAVAPLNDRGFLEAKGSEGLIQSITSGKGTAMPAWGEAKGGPLSEEEIRAIVSYLQAQVGLVAAEEKVAEPVAAPTPEVAPAAALTPQAAPVAPSLSLGAPTQGRVGEPLVLVARLTNPKGEPVANAPVSFLVSSDFFISGMMEVGEAVTDSQGVASIEFVPRSGGGIRAVVSSAGGTPSLKAEANIEVRGEGVFYHPEVGIPLPAPGPELFIGPARAYTAAEGAPAPALRLPGGLLSWLLIIAGLMATVWGTYIYVMYQVLGISKE